jgi:thiamine-monophosphate kinase
MNERDFVDRLLAGIPADPRLEVPPGDDAAVLRPPAGRRTVVTVDMLTEGVDFILGPDCPPRAVGHKALAVSLSDLAAMAARPEAAFVAVCLPRHGGDALGRGLLEGIEALARAHDVALAGGDTNSWDGPLVVSVTCLGSVPPGRAWRRDGARPGDLVVATGAFGGSLLGRHLAVEPRCREAAALAAGFAVHAAIDVSDGLALDLSRMMRASGVAAVVDPAAIPIHADALRAAARPGDGRTPLDHALADGEDFELVLAMPPEAARAAVAAAAAGSLPVRLTVTGTVAPGTGLFVRGRSGGLEPLEARGFLHEFDDATAPPIDRGTTPLTVKIGDEAALGRFAARLARALPPRAFVALEGDLGAGKTTLVKAVAAAVGIPPDEVVSPTFGLIHLHEGPTVRLVHADVYRLADSAELRETGWEDAVAGPGWVFVEWPSRIGTALPPDRLDVAIAIDSPTARTLRLVGTGPRSAAVVAALAAAPA